MFHVAITDLQHFLATYGYWAVFFFVAIESIGIPFPGETMLLVAAIDAGKTHQLSIALVIAAATCGAILGDNIGFWIGRFVAVLRAWAAFLAGVNRMPWGRFLLFNALGGFVWATLYGLGGYLLGEQIHRLTGPVGAITIVLAVLFVIAFAIFLWRNERQLEERAEKALPGPIENY